MSSCQNCKDIPSCNKSHNGKCSEFKLYGPKPIRPNKSKALCSGCRNNFYNGYYRNKGGCWSYKDAKVKLTSSPNSLSDRPPWRLEYRLSCFQRAW